MSVRLVFDGLAQLIEELRALPAALRDEAAPLAAAHADRAAETMRGKYRRSADGSGRHLQDSVVVTHEATGSFGSQSTVKNTAPHAFIFENGTQARHTADGRNRGAAAPGRVFIPTMARERHAFYTDLKGVVGRQGLEVSGDA